MNKILALAGRLYRILPQLLWLARFDAPRLYNASLVSKYRSILHTLIGLSFLGSASVFAVDIADRVVAIKPGVVGVGRFHPTRSPRAQLTGTGFVVGDGSHVVSCAHIFTGDLDSEKNETWAVLTGRDRQMTVRSATIVARDKDRDLVLLKIGGDALPALKLAENDAVREGWQLYFTGYPIGAVLGLNPSTHRAGLAAIVPIYTPVQSTGQLSPRTVKQANEQYEVYELDAIAYPGNSGSPVWNPDTGEVLAVVNSVFVKGAKETALTAPSGITYAIPIKYVRELLRQAGVGQTKARP